MSVLAMSTLAAMYGVQWVSRANADLTALQGYGYRGNWWGAWWLWIFWVAIIFIVFWGASTRGPLRYAGGSGRSAEAVLKERYARGELDLETYRRMLEEVRR